MRETRQWLRLVEACQRARRTQNQLYRLGALGKVRTRRRSGVLEFHRADLERLARERPVAAAS